MKCLFYEQIFRPTRTTKKTKDIFCHYLDLFLVLVESLQEFFISLDYDHERRKHEHLLRLHNRERGTGVLTIHSVQRNVSVIVNKLFSFFILQVDELFVNIGVLVKMQLLNNMTGITFSLQNAYLCKSV